MPKHYTGVTPTFLMEIAEPLEDVIRSIEDQLLLNVAALFNGSPKQWESTPMQWQAKKLAQLGALHSQNVQLISRYAKKEDGATQIAIEKTLLRSLKAADADLYEAWKAGKLTGTPEGIDETINRQLHTYQRQAQDRLNMVNTRMLNSSLEQARMVIANTQAYERRLAKAQTILNRRTGEVVTGASSRRDAVRRAVQDMAREGLTGFTDAAGHNWSP